MDYKEVAKHANRESCWVILYGKVYDVTDFLDLHPGGAKIILQLAGQDATEEYDPVHPPGTLEENLPSSAYLGHIDPVTLPQDDKSSYQSIDELDGPPPLDSLLNMDDIEEAATAVISKNAWAYYYSASDDLVTKYHNSAVYHSIILRPRIFLDCVDCSAMTTMLGYQANLPLFISPAAMARLAHPDGEKGIGKACATFGAVQMISQNASMTPEQIVEDAPPNQVFGWQIYIQQDRRKSEKMLARIKKLRQIKFIVLTLDAPVPGKREHDERMKNVGANLPVRSAVQDEQANSNTVTKDVVIGGGGGGGGGGGMGKALFFGTAADLTWRKTLPWLAEHTQLPIILKGVQTHEDAYLASLHTPQIRGIILSNHGGRAMDTAPPPIYTLLEIRKYCPEVLSKLEVFIDGGVKRGTDVVKALCLGAKGVGIGRPALFGLGVGGQKGVERVLEIFKAEIETCMRLLGAQTVQDLGSHHVNTREIEQNIYHSPNGFNRWKYRAQAIMDRTVGRLEGKAKL